MLALLAAIPGIGSFVATIVASVFNAKVQIATAKIGGDTAIATALVKATETAAHERTAALAVIAGNTLLTLLIVGFAGPPLIYEWKVVVYDTVLGLGSTPPIHGEVAAWLHTIIGFIFGTTGAVAIGKMWFGRGGAAAS
jgi:hypothetical protein